MLPDQLNLFSFSGKNKILHMTWLAFFISFVVWFNHAPLMLMIAKTLGMSNSEIKFARDMAPQWMRSDDE